jgi:hypothetical protein
MAVGGRPWRQISGLLALALLILAACEPPASHPIPEPKFVPVRTIIPDNLRDDDEFGASVAFDGNRLLASTIPAVRYTFPQGQAFLFEKDKGGTGAWGEIRRVAGSGGADPGYFGWAVALAGDTAFIGAPQEDDIEANAGAVHLFFRDQGGPGAWGEEKRLTAPDGRRVDYFGQALSVAGDTALVGAPGDSSAVPGGGAAYVFVRDQGGPQNWGETAKIRPADPRDAARFGTSVALDGDVAVVGAPADGVPGALYGAAYVFRRSGGPSGSWQEVKKLTAFDPVDWDGFGYSVAVSGDLAIVGAPSKHEAGVELGAAYLFGRDQGGPDQWGLIKKISAADGASGDGFGSSVSISGDHILIGAPYVRAGDVPAYMIGSVYVYGRDFQGGAAWGLMGKVSPPDTGEFAQFGMSTALSANFFAVGAPHTPSGGQQRGAVYIYRIDP